MDLSELKKTNSREIRRHPWELARLEVVLKLMNPFLKKENCMLDIGCGDLFFLEALNSKGVNGQFHAVDIAFSGEQITYFKERYKEKPFEVYQNLDAFDDSISQPASVVLLLDVIEHIENDIDFLKDLVMRKFISDDTLFFITVPAYQYLFCEHDVLLGHYRRYTNCMLKRHIEESGLEVVKLGYFFFTLFLARNIEKLRNKHRDKTDIAGWHGGKFITSLIKNVLILDAMVMFIFQKLGIKLPGLSNYVICRIKR